MTRAAENGEGSNALVAPLGGGDAAALLPPYAPGDYVRRKGTGIVIRVTECVEGPDGWQVHGYEVTHTPRGEHGWRFNAWNAREVRRV